MAKLLLDILIKVLSNLAVPFFLYLRGKREAKDEVNEERLDFVRKANNTRFRNISDINTAERVREKYTRK